jgi:Flp pilus assembly protein TadD
VRARAIVLLLLGVLATYLVLVGWRGVLLVRQGGSVPVLLGIAVLAVPLIGAYAAWREVRFGLATQRLARELDAAGRWPRDELPLAPSGRPQRAAADALFERRRVEVEQSPANWQAWFRLGLAYEDARDRRRARQSMRRAIELHG